MAYGIIEYDDDGKPICEICKKSFKRVLSHVRQIHDMNEREYKKEFGFDVKKGICSKESAERSRIKNLENYDKVVVQNLHINGTKSRFKDGNKGRTRDQVSQMTMNRLIKLGHSTILKNGFKRFKAAQTPNACDISKDSEQPPVQAKENKVKTKKTP